MPDLEPGSTAIVSTVHDDLNLRGQPNTNNPPVGHLARGSTVRIDGPPQGAFYPVTAPGPQYGFAAAAYLTAAPVDIPAPPEVGPPSPVDAPPADAVATSDAAAPTDVTPGGARKLHLIFGAVGALAAVVVAMVTLKPMKAARR